MMYSPIQLVADSVSNFNALFLNALHLAASERPDRFPLSPSLIDGFRALRVDDCRELAAGVRICLADEHFSDEAWWDLAISPSARPHPPESDPWMGDIDRTWLTQSLLMLAWNGMRLLPSFSRVLFGMSPAVQKTIEKLTLFQLSGVARSPETAIRPRWPERTDIWTYVLNGDSNGSPGLLVELRILQACATESSGMLSRAAQEFVRNLSLNAATALPQEDVQDSPHSSKRRLR